jgi:hypothetical protein
MGIRSFLRRWLGIESVEKTVKKTVKKTVGRAYQQPVLVRLPFEQVPYQHNSTYKRFAKTVADFYTKCGGYSNIQQSERTFGDTINWCRVASRGNEWRIYVKDCKIRKDNEHLAYSKVFSTRDKALSFQKQFIAYHERMKAKAAKSGLNYN